ncbi:MAG TPA: hypothetical protein PK055_08995 [Gammaproteobacteria bacterium]|nr:hypothetical protein [Xanthomonadales bacterium]MCB1594166.1 hypothetical protein [Xanthomonadales bacterium]HOP21972.1 hypothetical protein [Gammaproteobacteria bacterium]HPI95753.1 hypothetical protein [Gammaproteobacteria bacterium]HPQ87780.1 hypothetical protein [Gammaproteobacteria bacterium]
MQKNKITIFIYLLGFFILSNARIGVSHADENSKWNFNGYYTVDLTYADDDLVLVSNSKEQRSYKDGELSLINSIFGGQLEYSFNDKISAFVQGSLYADRNESIKFNLDWAYLSYDLGHDLNMRAGRFQIPFLSGTELRRVGFTRLWARPLIPGNGASGNEYHNGIEFVKHYNKGVNNWEFQLALGQAKHELEDVGNKGIQLFSTKYQRENFWIRSALMYSEFSLTSPLGVRLTDSGHAFLGSLESEWQFDKFQLNLGYSDTQTVYVPEDKMLYASLAYHINDKVTPYLVGVRRNQHFELFPNSGTSPPANGDGTPRPIPPQGDKDGYILGIGTRIELSPKTTLKFQLENIRDKDTTRVQNGIMRSDGNAFSIMLEGIF